MRQKTRKNITSGNTFVQKEIKKIKISIPSFAKIDQFYACFPLHSEHSIQSIARANRQSYISACFISWSVDIWQCLTIHVKFISQVFCAFFSSPQILDSFSRRNTWLITCIIKDVLHWEAVSIIMSLQYAIKSLIVQNKCDASISFYFLDRRILCNVVHVSTLQTLAVGDK